MDNAKTFGAQASVYASARPGYPVELFDWIAGEAPASSLVWDVGTGSGQAALALTDWFDEIWATDIDQEQINHAKKHSDISYHKAPAHKSGLPPHSVDAITVATALHWFDFGLFWKEVERVAKPNAIFCAWTYHRAIVDEEVQQLLLDPVLDVVEPYWSDGNRLSWRGYDPSEIHIPFKVIEMPEFKCSLSWTAPQIAALLKSWSAHKKARLDGHEDILETIERKALENLGDRKRLLDLPLNTIAARIAR